MNYYLLLVASIILASCTKVKSVEPSTDLKLIFSNMVGKTPLKLNEGTYTNGFGEDFTVSTLNYYISNISLLKRDGSSIELKDQYFLIRESDSTSLKPFIKNVPIGEYKQIEFLLGIDSLKSTSPVEQRTGVLDPEFGGLDTMYWSWTSGYLFFKFQGTSSVVPANGAGYRRFNLHIGGYGGYSNRTVNNLRKVTLALPQTLIVSNSSSPTLAIEVDLLKFFQSQGSIKLKDTYAIHELKASTPLANNTVHMFSIRQVIN